MGWDGMGTSFDVMYVARLNKQTNFDRKTDRSKPKETQRRFSNILYEGRIDQTANDRIGNCPFRFRFLVPPWISFRECPNFPFFYVLFSFTSLSLSLLYFCLRFLLGCGGRGGEVICVRMLMRIKEGPKYNRSRSR